MTTDSAIYKAFEAGFKACAKSMNHNWEEVAPLLDQAFGHEWVAFKKRLDGGR